MPLPVETILGIAGLGSYTIGKNPEVIKGRFYVSAPSNNSWEAFIPPHAGVTLGRFLH